MFTADRGGVNLGPQRRLRVLARVLSAAPWFILIVGPGWMRVVSARDPQAAQSVLTVSLGVFFVLLIARLVAAAVAQRSRRRALVSLICAVALFAGGSAILNGAGNPDVTSFPAPGEWLFIASYLAMAGYLVLSSSRQVTTAAVTWLETAVICGGTACLAGAAVLTTAASQLGSNGLPLLLAVVYPMIDVVLALLVVAQIYLGLRARGRQSIGLLLGFILLAIADSGFLLHLSAGTYDYTLVSVDLWGAGFALIVAHAARTRSSEDIAPSHRGMSTLVVAAGMAAAFVLAFEPDGPIRAYLLVPALATLTAAGARLVLAVRTANRAADAILLSRSDDLTSLPNRRAALARLDEGIASADPMGLMLLDLNGFKDINDTLGHGAGDAVLREIATRMRTRVDDRVMIARLGGDEFAVIAGTSDEIELMEIAQEVLAALREELVVDGITLSIDASIGITTRLDLDRASSELLRRADIAMYAAKEHRSGALMYDAHSDDFSRERLSLADELRRAIADRQLVLWYQPQIDARTRQVSGLEALVRWHHPQHGMMSPVEFLPAARRAGLMQTLSEEVGRLAVADIAGWQRIGLRPRVAINCAPPELMSEIFIPRLSAMLGDAGIAPAQIVIEVTEESFLAEPARARRVLLDIRNRGFQISIDDYGTGFSSLSYLRDLPVQELKMDRSFVASIVDDPRSRMIVASTFQMAAALGLRTVAEGVEDAATCTKLAHMGVDIVQGYYLSRPVPPDRVPMSLAKTYAVARPTLTLAAESTA